MRLQPTLLLSLLFFVASPGSRAQSAFDDCGDPACEVADVNISTGFDHVNGALYTPVTADAWWTLVGSPNTDLVVPSPAFVIDKNVAWAALPGANWLSAYQDSSLNLDNKPPQEPYTFERCICVCAPTTLRIQFSLLADNVADVCFDGATIASQSDPSTNSFKIPLVADVQIPVSAGPHCLRVKLRNLSGVAMGFALSGSVTTVPPGQPLMISPLCCEKQGKLIVCKFRDSDCDGVKDTPQKPLPGWTFTLTPGGQSAVTDAAGYAYFTAPPGAYTVTETPQPGWTAVTPPGGAVGVNITTGTVQTVDFLNCPTVGGTKDVYNTTGLTANDLEVVVKGTYPTVVSHVDGGFPTFEITPVAGLTQFRWSGMNVAPGAKVNVGGYLPGSTLDIVGAFWTLDGITIGCVKQVNVKYLPSHVAPVVCYTNTVTNCTSQALYAGDLAIEYYVTPPALDQLSATGVRSPIAVHVIPDAPVAIAPGGQQAVSVPPAPANAEFALLIFKVATGPALTGETQDYMLLPIEQPPEAWTNLGYGLPGVLGEPYLSGTGLLTLGSPGSLDLADAAPTAPALLLISVVATPTPFLGGTLVPVPFLNFLVLVTDPTGAIPVPWPAWPLAAPGLSLYFQYAVADAAAPFGAALSNAVRADLP